MALDYLRDPAAIYAESFRIAEAESDLSGIAEDLKPLVMRLIHAAGDPALAGLVAASPGAASAGTRALADGAAILADCEMVASGITRRLLPRANEIVCRLADPQASVIAARDHTTRSAAAVDLWGDRLDGAVVAIGNAPTALYRLIERLRDGAARPALIIAMPVGFVGAADAKAALIADPMGVAYVSVTGRRGGSALAAAAINALAIGAAR